MRKVKLTTYLSISVKHDSAQMIVYSILLITLTLAATSLLGAWRLASPPRSSLSGFLFYTALATFTFHYGAWVFMSIYCKYLFAIAFCAMVGRAFLKSGLPAHRPLRGMATFRLVLGFLLLLLSVLYYTGSAGTLNGTANLTLPFSHGRYFVFQGGKGLPTNVFHFTGRGTAFAMDIVKLNKFGNRAQHIFSQNLADYAIFGDTIYSPCSGTVASMQENNPDNTPPTRKRGPTNLNHVLIKNASQYVFLGHLQYHGVFVKEGDKVKTGQPLGLVGNSGKSIEPHLHIQAHANTNAGLPWYREPQLAIEFNGKAYLLFEVINAL